MKPLLLLVLLGFSSCATPPMPGDPAVYQPTQRITYPAPR